MNLFQSVTNALDIALAADSSAGKMFAYFLCQKLIEFHCFVVTKCFLYKKKVQRK